MRARNERNESEGTIRSRMQAGAERKEQRATRELTEAVQVSGQSSCKGTRASRNGRTLAQKPNVGVQSLQSGPGAGARGSSSAAGARGSSSANACAARLAGWRWPGAAVVGWAESVRRVEEAEEAASRSHRGVIEEPTSVRADASIVRRQRGDARNNHAEKRRRAKMRT